jgi:hypothetical protein
MIWQQQINYRFIILLIVIFMSTNLLADDLTESPIDEPEVFLLTPQEGDGPKALKFKAAMRLFVGYGQVIEICNLCQNPTVKTNYEKRNGNTLVTVIKTMKALGVLDKPKKDVVDEAISEGSAVGDRCLTVIDEIEDGLWDLYKAPRFKEDYDLMRSQ